MENTEQESVEEKETHQSCAFVNVLLPVGTFGGFLLPFDFSHFRPSSSVVVCSIGIRMHGALTPIPSQHNTRYGPNKADTSYFAMDNFNFDEHMQFPCT